MIDAQRTYDEIQSTIAAGLRVMVATHTRATVFSKGEAFKVAGKSLYARYGKRWDCIDYCAIRFERKV